MINGSNIGLLFDIFQPHKFQDILVWIDGPFREMENISSGLTFEDFVTIHTKASMQDITFARLQSTRVQTPLPPQF
jgi:hypothetical protein